MPKVREMIKAYFGGKTLNHSINPDEAVAAGAAI
jgi:L1 cell adhesion molecule like protein